MRTYLFNLNKLQNLNKQQIQQQKTRQQKKQQQKIQQQKIQQQKIQQQIRQQKIRKQIFPLINSQHLLLDHNYNNKNVNPIYKDKFYNNLNSNINSKKTIIHVLDHSNGFGDYLRGSIFLAQCAKFFNINLELDVSNHTIYNCIENNNETHNINNKIHSFYYSGDDNYTDKIKLVLLINKFKKSNNTKLYITTNLNYNIKILTRDVVNFINSYFKFKNFYYDEVTKLFPLTDYKVLHIRCKDECFDGEFNDETLISKIIELQLNKNTIVISTNYSLKQKLNKLFGFYFIDTKVVHTANTSNNSNDLYSTIIEYIILSKSSQTYCFSYYNHGSGFSEQCSVLNNVPYVVFYIPNKNIVNPDYLSLDNNINDNNNINYNNISFITLTNDGYIDYTLNCIKSLNDINIKQKLKVYCIGNNGYSILQQNNISCELIIDDNVNTFQEFKSNKWSDITFYKFQIIYEHLLNNEYVCFTDGDIVYENNNIFSFLLNNINDNEMLIQDDQFELCSGFMFIKSNQNTLSLFNPENVNIHKNKHINDWNDQLYINDIKHLIKYKKLPLYLFPTGEYYYKYNNGMNPYLIHFNWVVGHEKKNKMIYYNKWKLSNFIINICHHGTDGFGHQLEGHLRLLSLSINNKAKYINYNKNYTFEHNNFNMYKLIQYFTESLNNISVVTTNVTNITTYNYNIVLSENRTFDNILNYDKNILNNIYCYDGVSNKIGDTLPPNFETNNEIEKSLPILRDAFVKNNSYLPIQSYNNQFINVCCHIRLGDAIGQRILDTNNLFKVVKEFQKNNKYRVIIHTNGDVSDLQHSNTIIYSVNTDVLQVLSDFIFADILIMNYSSLSIAAHLLADDRQKVICPTNAGNTFKHRILNKCITTEHFLNNHVYNNKIEI
jgi:hypothetical protein